MLQERYLRWVLGMERNTPRCMFREELDRDKLKRKAGMKAWKYEKKWRKEGWGASKDMLEGNEKEGKGKKGKARGE